MGWEHALQVATANTMTDESFRNNCHFYQSSGRRVNAAELQLSTARSG